jgi:hypothetical protein
VYGTGVHEVPIRMAQSGTVILVIKPPRGAYKRSQILPEAEIAPPPGRKVFSSPPL